MDHVLQIVLAVVLVILTGFLAPLLLQLFRTAKAMQALAESAREDLKQIAGDIHLTRIQLEKVGVLAERSLEFPATASSMAAGAARSMGTLLGGTASPWVEVLVPLLKILMDLFRRPRKATETKETNAEEVSEPL